MIKKIITKSSRGGRIIWTTPFVIFCALTSLLFPHAVSYIQSKDPDGPGSANRLSETAVSFGAALALIIICLIAGLYYSLCSTLDRTLTTHPVLSVKSMNVHHFYLQGVVVTLGVALSKVVLQTLNLTNNLFLCIVLFLASVIGPVITRKGGIWPLPLNKKIAALLLTLLLPVLVIFF